MRRLLIFALATIPTVLCFAQDGPTATKLQCQGTFDDFKTADVRDVPFSGMYVEISGGSVKVQGSPGFDSTYSVINRPENGIGFQLDADKTFSGFVNRFDGQMTLMEKGPVKPDGSFKLSKHISALCVKAHSLF